MGGVAAQRLARRAAIGICTYNFSTICEQLISILINFNPQLTFGILIRFYFLLELVFLDYCLIEEFFTTALIISRLYQDTLHATEIKEWGMDNPKASEWTVPRISALQQDNLWGWTLSYGASQLYCTRSYFQFLRNDNNYSRIIAIYIKGNND